MSDWLLPIAIVLGVYLALVAALALSGRGLAARELALFVPNVAILFRGLLADPRVNWRAKALVAVAMVWIASPIDLIPEFIPIAGPLDDAIVAALVLGYVVRSAGQEIVAEHWRGHPGTLARVLRLARVPVGNP